MRENREVKSGVSSPLSGIRVVDYSTWMQGGGAGMVLGDLGAEVIKMEPLIGEFSRSSKSALGRSMVLPDGRSFFWETWNRNKKGMALDLSKREGREIVYSLLKKSDVFHTNYTTTTLASRGLDYNTVKKCNPDIIYASSSLFGLEGPDCGARGGDGMGTGRSGLMYVTGDEQEPQYPLGFVTDCITATVVAFATVTALLYKMRGGKFGQVHASQLSAAMFIQQVNVALAANLGYSFRRHEGTGQGNPLFNFYKCKDGRWIWLNFFVSDTWWSAFCKVMSLERLENDPRFATEILRNENYKELTPILAERFLVRTRDEWVEMFRKADLLLCTPINKWDELLSDPQVQANGYITELDNGIKTVSLPFKLDGYKPPRKKAPELGQHNEEILINLCGLSRDEIISLRDKGVF